MLVRFRKPLYRKEFWTRRRVAANLLGASLIVGIVALRWDSFVGRSSEERSTFHESRLPAPRYRIVALNPAVDSKYGAGSSHSTANAINASGVVVGKVSTGNDWRAYVWCNGTRTLLPVESPYSPYSSDATCINDDGRIGGWFGPWDIDEQADPNPGPILWHVGGKDKDSIQRIPLENFYPTFRPDGCDATGNMVGALVPTDNHRIPIPQGFIAYRNMQGSYVKSPHEPFGSSVAISKNGTIIYCVEKSGVKYLVQEKMPSPQQTLLGALPPEAQRLDQVVCNDSGVIALTFSGGGGDAWWQERKKSWTEIWKTATVAGKTRLVSRQKLGGLDEMYDDAVLSINRHGEMVGTDAARARQPNGTFVVDRAILWQKDGNAVDLNTCIPAHSGWKLTTATGINDNGYIVGNGTIDKRQQGFLLIPIPPK